MNKNLLMGLCTGLGASLMLAGCAESPSAPQEQQAAQSAPAVQTKTCQSDYSTGSHYNRTVECVTDEERDQIQQQTKQQMDMFRSLSSQTSAH